MSKKDKGWSFHKTSPLIERAETEREKQPITRRRHPMIPKVFTPHLLKLIKSVYHNQRKIFIISYLQQKYLPIDYESIEVIVKKDSF
jgi:hypothetical protein